MTPLETVISLWQRSTALHMVLEQHRFDRNYLALREIVQTQIGDIEAKLTRITGISAISDMDTLAWIYQQAGFYSKGIA